MSSPPRRPVAPPTPAPPPHHGREGDKGRNCQSFGRGGAFGVKKQRKSSVWSAAKSHKSERGWGPASPLGARPREPTRSGPASPLGKTERGASACLLANKRSVRRVELLSRLNPRRTRIPGAS